MISRLLLGGALLAGLAAAAAGGLLLLDRAYPPDLSRYQRLSTEIRDANGALIHVTLSDDGFYRLAARPDAVHPDYLAMLIATEDKRFAHHPGIDLLALARAGFQALAQGRIVSGASTLTMQTARLLEPRPRGFRAKAIEMLRALQLERRYGKAEILSIYLTLAPFGGNLEGLRAASLAYFGHEPGALTAEEAALLVALPQAPTRLDPRRQPAAALAARNKILARAAAAPREASDAPLPSRRALPKLAPHAARRLIAGDRHSRRLASTLDAALQARLETLLADKAKSFGPQVGLAALVVANEGREIRAYVGAPDFLDHARAGQVDMVTALRSPGSTLKPLIYGLAFDRGLAHPATLVNDAPTQFGDYQPANFLSRHYGEVTLAEALKLSLNVPAVALLARLGPVAFVERLRRDGLELAFGDEGARPGLAVALGGVGLTLEDLVRLYAGLASDGRAAPLRLVPTEAAVAAKSEPLLRDSARLAVGRILRSVRPPESLIPERYRLAPRGIAFKTGTSYGFRDAWAIGYSADYTVGIWVGRPDGTPHPGHYGANTAAPLLFEIFGRLPEPGATRPPGVADDLVWESERLSPALRRLGAGWAGRADGATRPPGITFPLDNSELALPAEGRPLTLEAEGGLRPLTWVIDGRPLANHGWARRARWRPDGAGFTEIVVVDALGRRAKARIRLRGDTPR